jgi:excinuclease ABC subunit B
MYAGDRSRKETLVEHGFRLPSAFDNRPMKFDEFQHKIKQLLMTTATPGKYEKEFSQSLVEQVIRPTGLVDPQLEIRPITSNDIYPGQVGDFIIEAQKTIDAGERVIATTLTKKMSEDLSEFLQEKGFKTKYLHSEILTIERIEILTALRKGEYDILIGVNLLREGIDMPEVSFIAIFDADKEGFLRSETSLIQTIGRAARNVNGRVILYADEVTKSMKTAIDETNRRREVQVAYNTKNGITPTTIISKIKDITNQFKKDHDKAVDKLLKIDMDGTRNIKDVIKDKKKQMEEAVKLLDFETAALLRDELFALEDIQNKGLKKKKK